MMYLFKPETPVCAKPQYCWKPYLSTTPVQPLGVTACATLDKACDAAAVWAPGLHALEGDIKAVAPGGRRALLRALHRRPAEAALLWLSCAHVAAWQRLPDAVLDRWVW